MASIDAVMEKLNDCTNDETVIKYDKAGNKTTKYIVNFTNTKLLWSELNTRLCIKPIK